MGGRTRKSKRPSGGSPGQSPLENFVLFLDERLHNWRPIHSALNELNVEYKRHGECFKPGVEDTEWLAEIGKQGWALLTSDKRIRYNQLERDEIVHYRIREFVFTSGNLSGAMMGEVLNVAMSKMKKLYEECPAPFIRASCNPEMLRYVTTRTDRFTEDHENN